MNNSKFFFITTFDSISGGLIANILNHHPDVQCGVSYVDPFLFNLASTCRAEDNVIDHFISRHKDPLKRFNGNAQRFSAFELQNKTLTEKCATPYRRVNLTISPALRINLLVKSWIDSAKTADLALVNIEHAMKHMLASKHELFELYVFHSFYSQVMQAAAREGVQLTVHNRLFLIAFSKVLTHDTADLPTSSQSYRFEQLLNDEKVFLEFLNYITCHKVHIGSDFRNRLKNDLTDAIDVIRGVPRLINEPWQSRLIDNFANARLHTIYHPHLNKPLITYYTQLGYESHTFGANASQGYSKLISIQLNSNRPAQLVSYFDNIEETADKPERVEVLVNIDEGDHVMESLIRQEAMYRKFTLKYICTPRPKSFCDLWQPINKLLAITDPDSYFLLNISDEMLFATKGWDTILQKYVGYFPDHLFRLRASRNKLRNYFDRWECSFGQDAIPITTKKWIDVGGDWNPCFGPDSFQQLIMFYLSKEGEFSSDHYCRELPLLDIHFHGDVPGLGIDRDKAWKHSRDHITAMQVCQSYRMQLEARRRAMLINARMIAYSRQLTDFDVVDVKRKKQIRLVNKDTQAIITSLDYRVSWFEITLTNHLRKFRFNAYFGAGKDETRSTLLTFISYLKAKYRFMHQGYMMLRSIYMRMRYKKSQLNGTRRRKNLMEENSRLKELYTAACLENESLQDKIIQKQLSPVTPVIRQGESASNAS